MREILFRGKRIDTGEWVFGDLIHHDPVQKDFPNNEEFGIFQNGIWYAVLPETVGQFTGLDDYNSKRIFEGNIISVLIEPTAFNKKYFGILSRVKKTAVIKYSDDDMLFHFEFLKDKSGMHPNYETMRLCDCDFEIIGNIHDNPELLKESD